MTTSLIAVFHRLHRSLRCGSIALRTALLASAILRFDGAAHAATATPPNIVVVIADDLTFRDIGCYGSPNARTPHLDALAAEGMRFTQCFSPAPMCAPTRCSIGTGLYPVKSGAYPNATWVKDGTKSVPHYLGALGYRVALTGKRHIAPEACFPFEYLSPEGDPDFSALEQFITRDDRQPFCAFVCFREPHTPWNKGDRREYDPAKLVLPPNLVDTPETRRQLVRYYAEVGALDKSVGKLDQLLERLGRKQDMLLIFTSEQGSAMPFAKWTLYDDGIRTALIARWPGHVSAGSRTDAMIDYVDLLPTFIDLAGGGPVRSLDGTSFLPVLLGQADHHDDYVFAEQTTRGITNGSDHYGIRAIRSSRYKYIWNLTPEAAFQNNATIGKGKWSSFWRTWVEKAQTDPAARELVERFQHRPGEELYDLAADPYELHNLAADPQLATIKADLRRRLLAWMKDQGDEGQATEMQALERTFKAANFGKEITD